MYRYEVQGKSVMARGPRGGTRWIATYGTRQQAEYVASFLNRNEGK